MKILYRHILLWAGIATVVCTSCSREEFLNAKPDASMTVPATLAHYQALMDSDAAMNGAGGFMPLYPAMSEIGTDNVWFPDQRYTKNIDEHIRSVYTWDADPYSGMDVKDWNRPYLVVLHCNLVLEGLRAIEKNADNREQWELIQGMALFHRSHAFAMLASVFAPAYEKEKADQSVGIPLRMSADVGEKLVRSTLGQTYGRITDDLEQAILLLPEEPLYKTRPSKRACRALLSRIYLWMGDFERSNAYADLCLKANDRLLDYNDYPTNVNYPFPRFNEEVIFNCTMMLLSTQVRLDTNLYKSYDQDDLRRVLFFKGQSPGDGHRFYGNYEGTGYFFAGLANDELYMTRAETFARLGEEELALADLNKLLKSRWRMQDGVSTYIPYTESDPKKLLEIILQERRKQLVWRGLRWPDLKRLNLEPEHATVLSRIADGETFELQANSPRYVYPVPDPVQNLNPNLHDKP